MRGQPAAAVVTLIVVTLALSPTPAPRAEDSLLLAAMQDELSRSMSGLRLSGEPAPYYIEYEIDDTSSVRFVARLGALMDDSSGHSPTMRVEIRVGDYGFDSSRFVPFGRGVSSISGEGTEVAPLDPDYDAIRRQLWLMSDAAYKRAVSVFARKKAAFQNRAAATTPLPDFSRETPTETVEPSPPVLPLSTAGEWASRVRQLSSLFAASPAIYASDVLVAETHGTSYYLNSEGFKTVTPIQLASFRVAADTQADDGMVLRDGFSVVERRLQDLPPEPALSARIREVANRLIARRVAPLGEEFTGPVLLEGQASGEFIAEELVPLMLARRPPDTETGRPIGSIATPFLTRIGLRVLSDSFTVSDTPSLTEYEGQPVPGAYVVDDEGIRAKDVTLVEKGRLVTLLTGRIPQKNLLQSNGHGRAGVQAGVFQMRSTQPVPAADLKAKYLDLLKVQDKPFGYIVRAIANPGDLPVNTGPGGGPAILDVVKLTPDGAEEPVRGLRFKSVPSTTFRDILEASQERELYNYRASTTDPVSVIVPNLLFEELELERTTEVVQKPPIVPAPTY